MDEVVIPHSQQSSWFFSQTGYAGVSRNKHMGGSKNVCKKSLLIVLVVSAILLLVGGP